MSFQQSFTDPKARDYIQRHLALPYPRLQRIEEEAQREGQPAVGRETGAFLRSLVATHASRRVLEVGTNLGYSALWMLAGMPSDGRLETIELDPDLAQRARAAFKDAGATDRITLHEGAALDVLPTLRDAAYDFIFLDAVKSEMPQYLDQALRLLRVGGLVVADNILWQGKAWDESVQDDDTQGVREYTRRIFADTRLMSTIVPVEDGLGISVRR